MSDETTEREPQAILANLTAYARHLSPRVYADLQSMAARHVSRLVARLAAVEAERDEARTVHEVCHGDGVAAVERVEKLEAERDEALHRVERLERANRSYRRIAVERGAIMLAAEAEVARLTTENEQLVVRLRREKGFAGEANEAINDLGTKVFTLSVEVERLTTENQRLTQQADRTERANIASRRSICEQSDRYKAERDEALIRLAAVPSLNGDPE